MNKLFTTLIVLFIAGITLAQAPPQGINYQAVAIDFVSSELPGTDVSNLPIQNKTIKVRFSIIKDEIGGVTAYREEHTTTTDENGLFDLIIGKGFQLSTNSFPDIDWGTGLHFLKVEIDVSGEFMNMGTQQLWSVPYALYTETAGNGITNIVDNGDSTATFNFENGISYTTNNYSGTPGPQGPQGPTGPQGPQGNDGNGIVNTVDNGDGTLTFEFDDGSTYTTPNLEGPQGPAGANGPIGPQGPQGNDGNGIVNTIDNGNGTLTFEYDDGSTFTSPNLEGPQGPAGATGPIGPQGPQGNDGNGIVNTIDNGDGTLTFEYDDGSTFTTPNLEGPQGPAGATGPIGPQGPQGIQGPQGTNGISVNWLGDFAAAPGSPGLNDAYYNTTDGISYIWDGSSWQIVAQDGTSGSGGSNTLNQAYNEGGPGAGRVITADNGAVEINNAGSNTTALIINTSITNSFGIDALNSNTGVALRGRATSAANNFPAIQGETNSSNTTNSAILGQNTGAGYAVAGQIAPTATGGAAIFGNNLRTNGGSGVSGVGVNGTIGESTDPGGFGIYGSNPSGSGLSIGTYGIGFNGVYGQTTDVTNGWAGYFTADVGIDGSVFALGAGNFNLSDIRLKTNLVPIESALDKLLQLNGKYYTIHTKHKTPEGKVELRERQEYGVIAQEVEALFPEMIKEKAFFINAGDDQVYKSVNYVQLVPVLIEAVKELNAEVEALEEELNSVEELKAEIADLRQLIESME